jgi:hypothetical protein
MVQLPEDDRAQLAPTVPTGVSDDVKATVPVGVLDAVVVSVTVAVHVEVATRLILAGPQLTLVDVLSFVGVVTLILPDVFELPLWVESPAYVAVTVKLPAATPVIVTVQVPVEPSAQLAPTVPMVGSDEVKLTVPVGVLAVLVVSETVIVQEPVPLTVSEAGQTTLVEVESFTTVIVPDVPELPLWVESPLYVPVTIAEPGATPVNATVQLPDDERTQLPPTVPTLESDEVNVIVPDGVLVEVVVSETVTVQVEVPPILIEAGLQTTLVEVASCTTVIVPDVPELPLWPGEGLVSPL